MIHLNEEEKCLVDSKTGKLVWKKDLPCWLDLVSYYHYLRSDNRSKEAQCLLKRAFKGDKVITNMLEDMHRVK